MHDGNRKITLSLDGARKKTVGTVTNTNAEFDESATKLQKMMTLDKLSSKILYADILDGIDLEYVVETGHIKENITIKEKSSDYSYTFTVQLNNLTAELTQDGSVHICDPDSDELVYIIPKGFMVDANGAYSDAVTYSITDNGNGTYTMTVMANSSWINDCERAFQLQLTRQLNMITMITHLSWKAPMSLRLLLQQTIRIQPRFLSGKHLLPAPMRLMCA